MERLVERLALWMAGLSCVVLIALMLVTFVDVIGRYFFSAPLTFAVELIQLGMGLLVLFGLAITTLNRGHISVDLVTTALPRAGQKVLAAFAAACGTVFIALISWRLMDRANNFMSDGLQTDILAIPVFPVVYLMAAAAAVAAVIALTLFVRPKTGSAEPEIPDTREM